MKIEFPLRTKSLNGSWGHWTGHAGQVKAQRARVAKELLVSGAKPPGPLLVVRLTRIAPRELDGDNLQGSFKAVRDQVAAWLGVDDKTKLVSWQYRQEAGPYGVRIEVEHNKDVRVYVEQGLKVTSEDIANQREEMRLRLATDPFGGTP